MMHILEEVIKQEMKANGVSAIGNDPITIITRAINEKTSRRVKGLQVEIENHKPAGELPILRINGLANTYYVKQLAQQGVLELFQESETLPYRLENKINVV